MRVSAVVVNYDADDLLKGCIASLYRELKRQMLEIIVVDNSSLVGGLDEIEKRYPELKVLRNEENLGFAKASNQGITLSRAEFVLLMNNDAEVKEGAVSALLEAADAGPRIGIVGPRLLNPDGTLQYSYARFPSVLRFLADLPAPKWVRYYERDGYDQVRKVEWLTGACLLLRKKMLDEIGLLDEALFLNFEDADLCKRAATAGWECIYTPTAEVIHYRAGSTLTSEVRERVLLEKRRSQLMYFRKHTGAFSFYLMKGINLAYALAQLLRHSVTSKRERRELAFYMRLLAALWEISPK